MRRKTRRAFAPYCWIVPKNILAVVLVVFTSVQLTNAQNPLRLAPITIDSTDIIGTCSNGAQVGGTVSHGPYQLSITPVACTGGQFKIDASSMLLRNGDLIEVNQVIGGATSETGTVVAGDAREDLEAEGYIGFAIDTFSSGEIQRYYNQTANAKPQERGVFGLDFGYRLVQGKPRWPFQLWLYGKTAHGVRSADVDCAKNPNFPTCLDAEKSLEDLGKNIPQNALYMLRNATSLEGSFGFRFEAWPVNKNGTSPAMLYFKAQAGFADVAGSDSNALDIHHLAIGATAVAGPYKRSYLEIGHGRTDLFVTNRYKRYKVDGYLQRHIGSSAFSMFARLLVDVDLRRGTDAIQPSFGLSFDVQQLFSSKAFSQ